MPRAYIDAGSVHHIVYRSEDAQIVELFINSAGEWNFNILTITAGSPRAAGNPHGYSGLVTQHVAYGSTDGDVVELFINAQGNWVYNRITAIP